ncbi:MAG: hypothetical protein LBH25_04530 [Fibromonadaceae bacterium]|jgi:hypothetical protein|nr:hypothetical protein [Fibromonadaceae bacterium]
MVFTAKAEKVSNSLETYWEVTFPYPGLQKFITISSKTRMQFINCQHLVRFESNKNSEGIICLKFFLSDGKDIEVEWSKPLKELYGKILDFFSGETSCLDL